MSEQLIQLRSKKQKENTEVKAPEVIPSTFWIYKQKVKIFFYTLIYAWRSKHSLASLRRLLMSFLAPESYRKRMKARLEGACNQCGHCCKINFKCPFFAERPDGTGSCTIYLTKHAPKVCVVFPLDPWDLEEIQRSIAPNKCSFSFAPEEVIETPLADKIPMKLRKLLKIGAGASAYFILI